MREIYAIRYIHLIAEKVGLGIFIQQHLRCEIQTLNYVLYILHVQVTSEYIFINQ